MTFSYLLTALVSSLIGGVVGWFAGRGARKAVGEEGGAVLTSKAEWIRTGISLVLLALMVWTVASGIRVNQCQAQNNRLFAESIVERTEAANVERDASRIERNAMRDAIRGTPLDASVEAKHQAGQRYLAALDQADRLITTAAEKRAAAPPIDAGVWDCGWYGGPPTRGVH